MPPFPPPVTADSSHSPHRTAGHRSDRKSVFALALYHALANLSVQSMFSGGSYEAERLIALILAAMAARSGGRGRWLECRVEGLMVAQVTANMAAAHGRGLDTQ